MVTPSPPPATRTLWVPPALLLISASLAKFSQPLPFLAELANYGLNLPALLEGLLALALPALEMALGLALLLGLRRGAALGSLALLAAFTLGIILALPAGYLHRCGCLGPEAVNPELALVKNAAALLLLGAGFLPSRRSAPPGNPSGAFALVAGGVWGGPLVLPLWLLALGLAAHRGRDHLLAFLAGLALGLGLRLAGFPLLTLVAAGTAVYFFSPRPALRSARAALPLGAAVLILTTAGFLWPSAPAAEPPLLRTGQPWPPELTDSPAPSRGGRLYLLLQPDCEECRDWLPQAAALARLPETPPLHGLIPRGSLSPAQYAARENLPFPVRAVDSRAFAPAARRTPLLVWVRDDTVRHIFPEGSLPPASSLRERMDRHAP
ncbi:MAG: hypothetical protein C4524_13485 [Candidatus Zixiibacteriota bacterium]|nr:MAG: hypothetical protein C4524_13485 [candidate division Zixibacteria bacterium]